MVYKKRTYKKRRYYRRKKLSKANIFGNKSAKGQAKQIYSLNKKINRIEKQTKPEMKIYENTNWMEDSIDCRGDSGSVIKTDYKFVFNTLKSLLDPFSYDGKICRINTLMMIFNMSIARSAQNNYDALPQDAYVRITIQRIPKQLDRTTERIVSLHTLYGGTDGALYRVKGPLCQGCTAQGKILYDHTFKLSDKNTMKLVKVKFNNFVLRNANQDNYFDAGELYVMYTLYNASGSNVQPSPAVVKITSGVKVAYVDEYDGNDDNRGRAIEAARIDNKYKSVRDEK